MIQRLEITGVHLDADQKLKSYVARKIGGLDRYVSRHTRESLHAEVKLKELKTKNKDQQQMCEVILHLPQETFALKEQAQTIYAAVDLAEQKLKLHLKKYKDLHTNPRLRSRLLARLKNRTA